MSAYELMIVSERAINFTLIFDLRAYSLQKGDWLPSRFFQPKTSWALSKDVVHPDKLRDARTKCYHMMG